MLEPIVPEFLLLAFKKKLVYPTKLPQPIQEFMLNYAKYYQWSELENITRIFKIMRQGITTIPTCGLENCNSPVYIDYDAKVLKGCCRQHNTILTSREKYGVDHVTKTREFQDAKKITNLEKYGAEFIFQSLDFKAKRENTMISKYGVIEIMQDPIFAKKQQESTKKTVIEKYDCEYVTQTNIFKEKSKQTNLLNLGVEYPMQSDIIKLKSKKTCMINYGVSNPLRSSVIKKKIRIKMENAGCWTKLSDMPNFIHYSRLVWLETRKNDLTTLPNHDRRGKNDYHLDHKYSIFEGFKNNILPSIIGNIKNLEFIPYKENLTKGKKSSVDIDYIL